MSPQADAADWVPVALSDALPDGTVMRVETAGHDLALWRGNDHGIRCVDNRCPHRGMRLSFGFVRGNRLNCIYHGWQYGPTGACEYIPAHPDLTQPASLCVPTRPCVEQGGLVWLALGDDPAPLPAMAGLPALRSLAVTVSASTLRRALASDTLPATAHPVNSCTPTRTAETHGLTTVDLAIASGAQATLVIAIQSVAPDRSQLHTCLTRPATADVKIAASRWLEALRTQLEDTA